MTRDQLLRQFSLTAPSQYHADSLRRISHLNKQSLRKAAVLIPCIDRPDGIYVLFTKRASHLKHHAGEVSFPGGKYELFDRSLADTALRETNEEVGVLTNQIQLLGQLPSLVTVSQFEITPFVALVKQDYRCVIDPNEVDSVFEVPANYLFNPQNLHTSTMILRGNQHPIFSIHYQKYFIWGVTGQIIQSLQNQLQFKP
ncbi:CoA pyrophosphatase [Vibrio sp. S11_S32]|uniref:CoA pyrophosphatase n=1 Tax=Vibrio sp. S11_S32 TaxID=2720225 RepID=UPI001681376D|nr:CoA pyrophosphatase [Vibrio sp. S11_S32]MBD1577004.1 CoA pyrophosphatase [Vibrio sp. S11_S32]